MKKMGLLIYLLQEKNGSIIERCVSFEFGKKAITNYNVISEFNNYSLLRCELKTGKTHQIRIHTSAISHPIIGDTLYGNKSNLIDRQALHSYKISCFHPINKKSICFESKMPTDMENLKTNLVII